MQGKSGEAWIPCIAWPGWFSHERIIRIDLPDVKNIIAFVDEHDVLTVHEPTEDSGVNGYCRVYIIALEEDLAIVDLPQKSFIHGMRFRVPRDYLRDDFDVQSMC